MRVKVFEVRDRNTFIAVFAFRTAPDRLAVNHGDAAAITHHKQSYLLRRCGWAPDGAIVGRLDNGSAHADAYDWGDRTMTGAHLHIEKNWDKLEDGDVIDVEFILGESAEAKTSERVTP